VPNDEYGEEVRAVIQLKPGFEASEAMRTEILAYAGYVVAGVEQPDAVGIATKLVEASVICLVLVGCSSHRLAAGGSALRNLASPRAHGGFLR
jgi:hypothetical protein